MKKFLALAAVLATTIFFISCDEGEESLPPVVTAPSAPTNVQKNGEVSVSFQYEADGGFASATVVAAGGTATISTNGTAGEQSGTIAVSFAAGATAGAGSITLSVTDAEGQTASGTAVINIQDTDAPVFTNPGAQSVKEGETLAVSVTVSTAGGFASATVSEVTGGTATVGSSPAVGAASGVVVVNFAAGATPGLGAFTLTVTDNDSKTASVNVAINISASAVPSIAGIPATASVVAGTTLGPVNATITMEDVPGTLVITKNGQAFGTEIAITADGQVVPFSYPSTLADASAPVEFAFTVTDADGDMATATHVLVVTVPTFPTKVIESNITSSRTWFKDTIYELATRVTVVDGVTLTIQAGTVVKGQPGTGANATALLVARGAKLMAEGTASAPIIFTSTTDEIIPGYLVSPNLAADVNGLWGGVLILGKAPISASNDDGELSELQIEGIPTSDPNGLYGGNVKNDNSGVITYISIRHGGTNIGSGNEINGLTLGGVGSGTVIENVEVVANQDDGIEFFGGTVSVKNALIWNSFDDALDTDQAWNGTVDGFIVVAPNTGSAFELDGPEGTYKDGNHTFINGVVYAGANIADLIDFDPTTNADMENIYFFGISNSTSVREYKAMSDLGNGTVTKLEYTIPADKSAATIFLDIPAAQLTAVDGPSAKTVGPTKAGYEWTWAYVSGALAELGSKF